MKQILVVDDDFIGASFVQYVVEKQGNTCFVANNGLDAVNIIKKKHFDLIFMDINMPLLNGFEAAKQIRNKIKGVCSPNVPIIAISSSIAEDIKDECFDAGMNLYLPKPISILAIKSVLNIFLNT